jgi:hypothetical protein
MRKLLRVWHCFISALFQFEPSLCITLSAHANILYTATALHTLTYYCLSTDCAVRNGVSSNDAAAAAGDTAVVHTSSCTAAAVTGVASVHCSMTAAEVTTLQRRNARLEADNATARRTVALLKHQLDKV